MYFEIKIGLLNIMKLKSIFYTYYETKSGLLNEFWH